jgi:predicted RNA-binding protein YlqC (UPF0109 family)
MSVEPSAARVEQPGGDIRLLVEYIARSLVDAPDQVSVEEVEEGDTTVFELRVAPGDVGKVIGKQGRTARAVRTVLGATGAKLQRHYTLEIVE